ncbi:MAG: PqqD family protein [Paracoccaceae bacterium]
MKSSHTRETGAKLEVTMLAGPADGLSVEYVGDDVLVLDETTGKIHWFNKSAAVVWKGLAEGRSATEIADTLRLRYRVSRQRAEQDIDRTIAELISLKLFNTRSCCELTDT